MDLQTKNFHVTKQTDGTYKAWVFDHKMCNKMNRLLQNYGDYKFEEGEEGIFSFREIALPVVKKILKIKG